jgi:hypothetical protein
MPLICAADAISIVIRLGVNLSSGLSLQSSASTVLKARYQCCDYCDGETSSNDDETFQDLEKQTTLRCLAFLYGVLPVAIKLCAVKGIPWTTTWATMYLVDFLVVELVLFFADSHPAATPTTTATTSTRHERVGRNSSGELFYQKLGDVASYIQSTLLVYSLLSTSTIFMEIGVWPFLLLRVAYCCLIASPELTFTRLPQSFPIRLRLPTDDIDSPTNRKVLSCLQIFSIFASALIGTIGLTTYSDLKVFYLSISFVSLVLFLPLLEQLSLRWGFWRKNIYFLRSESTEDENPKKVELRAAAIFSSLLFITVYSFMWYGFLYDAENTYKPAWLEWLG